jgi:hypothetical protein
MDHLIIHVGVSAGMVMVKISMLHFVTESNHLEPGEKSLRFECNTGFPVPVERFVTPSDFWSSFGLSG